GVAAVYATRLAGSADIFDRKGRRPWAGVNFVTSHDGFTLRDLVTYERKHNEANREGCRDGTDNNISWNCGVEGPSDEPAVRELRARQQRNFLATLMLSQGIPMLTAGDELGRSQRGNNNAYCQDDETSWLDWSAPDHALLAFVRQLVRLRRDHVVLHRRRFFHGERIPGAEVADIVWLTPEGTEKTAADWEVPYARYLCCLIHGEAGEHHLTARGVPQPDDSFLLMMNAGDEAVSASLPPSPGPAGWELVFDTAAPEDGAGAVAQGQPYAVAPHSFVLLTSALRREAGAR
ncbi:MAG: glycogen debranching enzyme GlgX, partial [Deltaproteobacteria bacterium]|nr:glycogen debranching enzyme GlgX [Deltaproteobacteria bacterium]